MITFKQILSIGIRRLEQASIADAELDANLLMQYMMHEDNKFIFMHGNDGTDEAHAEEYFSFIDRRAEGEPLQYITGSQEFMGYEFEVNRSVLIPRQDTESVVEFAIKKAQSRKKCSQILDMCCGSGAIAVSLAKALPKSDVTACDRSAEALETAGRNAERNGVAKRVTFMKTDMFETVKRGKTTQIKGKFDMIVCNPPYVPSEVIETLQPEVRNYEPRMALDGGVDGLDFYRVISRDACGHLKKSGMLILEIGHDQGEAVTHLLREMCAYADIEIHKDLVGHDRIIYCVLA